MAEENPDEQEPQKNPGLGVARAYVNLITSPPRDKEQILLYTCALNLDFFWGRYKEAYICFEMGKTSLSGFTNILHALYEGNIAMEAMDRIDGILGEEVSPLEKKALETGARELTKIGCWFIDNGAFVDGYLQDTFNCYCRDVMGFMEKDYFQAMSGCTKAEMKLALDTGDNILLSGNGLVEMGLYEADRYRPLIGSMVRNLKAVSEWKPEKVKPLIPLGISEPAPIIAASESDDRIGVKKTLEDCEEFRATFYEGLEIARLLHEVQSTSLNGFEKLLGTVLAGQRALDAMGKLKYITGEDLSPAERSVLEEHVLEVKAITKQFLIIGNWLDMGESASFDTFLEDYESFSSKLYPAAMCSLSSTPFEIEEAYESGRHVLLLARELGEKGISWAESRIPEIVGKVSKLVRLKKNLDYRIQTIDVGIYGYSNSDDDDDGYNDDDDDDDGEGWKTG